MPRGEPHRHRAMRRALAGAPREVCELALAHVNTNAIEAAYRRPDMFERRRALMEQWASFVSATEDQVARRCG